MKNLSEKGDYTKEDLDEALECVIEAVSIMNNKELMALVKEHAKSKGEKIGAIKEFSADTEDGKISSIKDLRNKKYDAFKGKEDSDEADEEEGKKPKSIKDIRKKSQAGS